MAGFPYNEPSGIDQGLTGGTLLLMGSAAFREQKLPDCVTVLIDEAIDREMKILVGEAGGASRYFQDYLSGKDYRNVTVGYTNIIRYNAGGWETEKFGDALLEKERALIEECDSAVIIWTNHSGVIKGNIRYLKKLKIPTFVYECWSHGVQAKSYWIGSTKYC